MRKNKNKKPEPFYAPGSTTEVTEEEIALREWRIKETKKIGISLTQLDGPVDWNPYRGQALCDYILSDRPVPEEVVKKIEAYDRKKEQKIRKKLAKGKTITQIAKDFGTTEDGILELLKRNHNGEKN